MVRWGVLGTADIAVRRMLPALAAHEKSTVVTIGSRDVERAAALASKYKIQCAGTYFDVLLDPGVDAVYLPLPNALHAPWIERAIEAGKHVLAEKPLTMTAQESARLFDLADRSGCILMECMTFPRHAQHQAAAAVLSSGAIGTLRSVSAAFEIPDRPSTDIRYDADLGGGALLDVGVYPLSVVDRYLGPDVDVVDAHSQTRNGVDVGATVSCRTASSVTAVVTYGLGRPYRNNYEIVGSTGSVRVDRAFSAPSDALPKITLTGEDGMTHAVSASPDDQFVNTIAAFVDAVDDVDRRPWRHSVQSSLRVARLVDTVRDHGRRSA